MVTCLTMFIYGRQDVSNRNVLSRVKKTEVSLNMDNPLCPHYFESMTTILINQLLEYLIYCHLITTSVLTLLGPGGGPIRPPPLVFLKQFLKQAPSGRLLCNQCG